jgi:hypothetical protein
LADPRLVPMLARLQTSKSGAELLAELGRRGTRIVVVSDAEFSTKFSTDAVAASVDTDAVPARIVLGESFLLAPPDYVVMAIAHEAIHIVDDARFREYSALHPGDALIWAETIAAAAQGVVWRELGIGDVGPGGSAARADGTLRDPEGVARGLRRSVAYAPHVDPSRRPALRWPLSSVHPVLFTIIGRGS